MRAAAFSSGTRRTAVSVQCKESRIGSKPIVVPKGVTVDLKGSFLKVKVRVGASLRPTGTHIVWRPPLSTLLMRPQGPKGELELQLTPYVTIEQVCGLPGRLYARPARPDAHQAPSHPQNEGKLLVKRAELTKKAAAMHGLSRCAHGGRRTRAGAPPAPRRGASGQALP